MSAISPAAASSAALRIAASTPSATPPASAYEVEPLGSIAVDRPAFATLVTPHEGDQLALAISSFRVFGGGAVRWVPNVGQHLANIEQLEPTLVTDAVTWPNAVSAAPTDALPVDALVVPGGFLVPGKGNGSISLVPLGNDGGPCGPPQPLTREADGWFYHQAEWMDMNHDGRADIVTARAKRSMLGGGDSELVWLEQPKEAPLQGPWREHVLAKGPDVYFQATDIDGDGRKEIIAARFFDQQITVYWNDAGTWRARLVEGLGSRPVDAKSGAAFDLQVVDLNGDGRPDLLATNHQGDGTGAVFAYEIPTDFKNQPWVKHTLEEGIETRAGFQSAAPGQAQAFWPDPARREGKPWMLVAGDGAQQAWLLAPRSADAQDWSYDRVPLTDTGCTVGGCAVGDVDGDGCVEMFVPAFERNEVEVFRLRPHGGAVSSR